MIKAKVNGSEYRIRKGVLYKLEKTNRPGPISLTWVPVQLPAEDQLAIAMEVVSRVKSF
jgi:hypothetical protein